MCKQCIGHVRQIDRGWAVMRLKKWLSMNFRSIKMLSSVGHWETPSMKMRRYSRLGATRQFLMSPPTLLDINVRGTFQAHWNGWHLSLVTHKAQNVYDLIHDSVLLMSTGQFLFNVFEMSDLTAGVVLLVASLTVLCSCLICLVKVLSTLLKGRVNCDTKYM